MGNAKSRGSYADRKAHPIGPNPVANPMRCRWRFDKMTPDQIRAIKDARLKDIERQEVLKKVAEKKLVERQKAETNTHGLD